MVTRKISILQRVSISAASRLEQQQTITVIISGTDYVLYSILKGSNMSLNIILCDI